MQTRPWLSEKVDQVKSIRVHTAIFWTALLFTQASIVGIYLLVSGDRVTNIRYLILYPFLWINLSIWVFLYIRPNWRGLRPGALAGAIAIVYFGVLVIIPSLLDPPAVDTTGFNLRIRWLIPGWGPFIGADMGPISVGVTAFQAVGYAALAYLVSLNLMGLRRGSFAGLLGVVTCVGCTVPVIVPILGGLGGLGSALAAATTGWYLDLGTLVFILAVGLLYRSLPRHTHASG